MAGNAPTYVELYKGETRRLTHILPFAAQSFEWSVCGGAYEIGDAVLDGRRLTALVSCYSPREAIIGLKAYAPDGSVHHATWHMRPAGGDSRSGSRRLEQESLQNYLATENGEPICEDSSNH